LAMNQQHRRPDLIRIPERRHLRINVLSFPERSPFRLKAKWSQSPVISPALRNPGMEQIRMRQQIGGHECAITMAEYSNAIAIDDSHFDRLIDSGPRVHLELLNVSIIHRVRIAYDWHRGIIQQRVPVQYK